MAQAARRQERRQAGMPVRRWRGRRERSAAWVFVGTRVPLSAPHENLADRATVDEFVELFPGVDRRQVHAVTA